MTDLVQYHEPGSIAPVSESEFALILRQADALAQAAIIPAAYRRQPANIVAAALTGRSFGWDVLTAMRNGHVIEGTWSLKPEAMLALVRRAGHSVNGTTSPEGATVTGKRRDSGDEMTVSFTLEDARRAGLANKGTWKSYPQAMCWARAVSQLCRMLFADVTLGLAYTPEELGAEVTEDGEPHNLATSGPVEPEPLSEERIAKFRAYCAERNVDPYEAVRHAFPDRDPSVVVTVADVPALKNAADELAAQASAPAEDGDTGSPVGEGKEEVGDPTHPPASSDPGSARRRFFALVSSRWGHLSEKERDKARLAWIADRFDGATSSKDIDLAAAADLLQAEVDELGDIEVVEQGTLA